MVFSVNVPRLAIFYETVLGAKAFMESSGDIRLCNEQDEVLIHSVPEEVANALTISSPPAPRENAALKPVFDVASLEQALRGVRATGGVVTDRGFSLHGSTRHDVLDPDGNVLQLRCRVS